MVECSKSAPAQSAGQEMTAEGEARADAGGFTAWALAEQTGVRAELWT